MITLPSIEQLESFLREANRNTYANDQAKRAESLRPQSHDYHFEKGNFAFHDTYFGGEKFMGEEVIYFQGQPIWGMNYYGRLLAGDWNESGLDRCLREALMQKTIAVIPVRGPQEYASDTTLYRFEPNGTLESFTAVETITVEGALLYRCELHGGLIR